MELQLALDRIEKKRAIDIVESLKDLIDIVEIGTPFSIMQPIEIINDFKKISPCLRVLADYKIMENRLTTCIQTTFVRIGLFLLTERQVLKKL